MTTLHLLCKRAAIIALVRALPSCPVMQAGVTLIQPPNCERSPGSQLGCFGFMFERFSYGPEPVSGVSLHRDSVWHRCQESPPCRCMQEAHSCYWWRHRLSGDGVKHQIRTFISIHTSPVIFLPEPKQNQDCIWIPCKVGDSRLHKSARDLFRLTFMNDDSFLFAFLIISHRLVLGVCLSRTG